MAFPTKDNELLPYSTNFNTRLTASPTTYELVALQAAAYNALHVSYADAQAAVMAARESGTISQSLTVARNNARTPLLDFGRELYAFVQANTSVSDANKVLLGVHIIDRNPTPVPPPAEVPFVELIQAVRRTVRVRVNSPSGLRRRPTGTAGAQVFYAVGAMPTQVTDWDSAGLWTNGGFDIQFPLDTPDGSQVWISAAYFNRKGEYGPMADALRTNLPGGVVEAIAA